MELNELITLSAASLYPHFAYPRNAIRVNEDAIARSITVAKQLWLEVLRRDKE